jgi:hypothetical protein
MDSQTDIYELKIELKIKNLLGHRSLLDWCKEISDEFITQTKQTAPPFCVAKFLPHRRIKAIHDRHISISGRIEKNDAGFLLKMNPDKFQSQKYYNFVLAHEVAHTFFYDTKKIHPIDISGFSPGSIYLEYLCNKIARFLLIPTKAIEDDLSQLPQLNTVDFTLEIINGLIAKYATSDYTLLTRLIVDEPLWKCLFFRFKYFKEIDCWKLIDTFKPRYINSFVPQADKKKGKMDPKKYPTAKSSLNKFLRQLNKELIESKRITKRVCARELYGEPLGSLNSIYDSEDEVTVHTSYYHKEKIINLLIPLHN